MALLNLEIGGRAFSVTCQDGEEEHITKLAAMVSERAYNAGDPSGLTESRMLLFASLMLADDLHGAQKSGDSQQDIPPPAPAAASNGADEKTLIALEKLADRAEAFANSLEQSNLSS